MKSLSPALMITLACLGAFVPFIHKPLFVDDHAIFEQARDLVHQPAIPYRMEEGKLGWQKGQDVGEDNPPLFFYGLAATIKLFGDEPWTSRAATLPIQILGMLAFYALAKRYVRHPLWATLLLLATPHVWVTSNSLLVDSILGPVLWMALFAWIRAWESSRFTWGLTAGILLGLAPLVKYTGLIVWAVAGVWVLIEHQRWKSSRWLWSVIPLFLFGGWLWYTRGLYGADHFSAVAGSRMTPFRFENLLTVLSFTTITTPAVWMLLLGVVAYVFRRPLKAAGIWDRQNSFLCAWIGLGVAGLSIALGWTCARFLVILSAPLILFSVRAVEALHPSWIRMRTIRGAILGAFAAIGLLVMHADWARAKVEQDAAVWANDWVQRNNWTGPAYYPGATRGGLSAYLDSTRWKKSEPQQEIEAGALLLIPQRGLTPYFLPAPTNVRLLEDRSYRSWNPVRLVDSPARVGWYGSIWGHRPLAFSNQAIEIYQLLLVESAPKTR